MRNLGKRKYSKTKEVLKTHLKNNIRQYSIVLLLFIIGMIFGIIFVNNSSQIQIQDITSYLNDFINSLKNDAQINKGILLKETLISNLLLSLALWFVGSTVIGIPIVYGIIAYRGFCLGYTISSVIATFGAGKRNTIYYYIYIITKYNSYSMYTGISSKWNKIIWSNNKR